MESENLKTQEKVRPQFRTVRKVVIDDEPEVHEKPEVDKELQSNDDSPDKLPHDEENPENPENVENLDNPDNPVCLLCQKLFCLMS